MKRIPRSGSGGCNCAKSGGFGGVGAGDNKLQLGQDKWDASEEGRRREIRSAILFPNSLANAFKSLRAFLFKILDFGNPFSEEVEQRRNQKESRIDKYHSEILLETVQCYSG